MNERDLIIWMAGFFDGEGCVSVGRARRVVKSMRRPSWSYALQLAVAQRHREPLQRFMDLFGGNIYAYRVKGVEYWRWSVSSHRAQAALEKLLPYLLNKRPIAEVGIRFQIQMTAWNREHGRRGYPTEIVAGMEAFYYEARALNAKARTNNHAPKYEGPQALGTSSIN